MTNILKRILTTAALGAAAMSSAQAGTSVDFGVGVTIREPGVYGRVEIGNRPPPPVLYPQPMIIAQPAVVIAQPPAYLYVPPGHAKNWRKHCHRYEACGRQVYFVQEQWVHQEYARAHPGKGPPKHAKGGRGKGKDRDDD